MDKENISNPQTRTKRKSNSRPDNLSPHSYASGGSYLISDVAYNNEAKNVLVSKGSGEWIMDEDGIASLSDGIRCSVKHTSGYDLEDTSFAAEGMPTNLSFTESPKVNRRSSRILKRISSTTSFEFNILARKRKREVDEDAISIQSLQLPPVTDNPTTQEKKTKRMSMKKMSSLVTMLSPANNRVGRALERSFSFKAPNSPVASSITSRQITPYKKPKPATSERRTSRFWSETIDQQTRSNFSSHEIKRQEAIYELVQGEQDLIEDLSMVHKLYHNSMKKLRLMTDEELDSIFGIVERLVPLHEEFLKQLQSLRKSNGLTDTIGQTVLSWVPNLRQYETYCANQVFAKGLLDYKKSDPKVEDFLTRCQESSFSRKLDLWNFLDLPRSRLVKYPLLLKQIHKQTSDDHTDKELLQKAIDDIEEIIKDVDVRMGESKCRHVIQSLEFSYESQKSDLISQSNAVICSGQLKNDRGTKVHVFLFEKVLLVTRQATRNNKLKYQVIKDPIPLSQLELADLSEAEGRSGSFKKKVLGHPSTDKFAFRISNRSGSTNHSHTLHALEEHDKRQWLTSIQKAMASENNSQCTTESISPSKSSSSSTSSLGSIKSDTDNCKDTEIKYETVV